MKQNKLIQKILITSGLLFLFSCKKENIPYDATPKTFGEVFNIFWNQVNRNYLYWEIDSTNWNEAYSTYKPLFEKLNLNNENDLKKSVFYFKDMCKSLVDGHFYIDFTKSQIDDSLVYPSFDRKKKSNLFHNPFPYFTIVKNYLDSNYYEGIDNITNPSGIPLYTLAGTIDNKALYFHCSSFTLLRSFSSVQNNNAKPVLNYLFENLRSPSPNIKGIILDLRNNSGGNLSDLNFLAGQFIYTPLHFGFTRHKNGNGRLEYSPWLNAYINPQRRTTINNLPIIILVDSYSASITELITLALKCLSQKVVVIGENTWGATGPITSTEVYNFGNFEINGFMSVQLSSAAFKTKENNIYESSGIPPDIPIPFDKFSLQNGHDKMLERAIIELL
jgi:hypothetical protein